MPVTYDDQLVNYDSAFTTYDGIPLADPFALAYHSIFVRQDAQLRVVRERAYRQFARIALPRFFARIPIT